jgi:hypothetical protein
MKILALAENVSGTAVAAQTGVQLTVTPLLPGRNCIAVVYPIGLTGTPTILIQSSSDNSAWTTVATHTGLGAKEYNIAATDKYMRANVTVAAGAGTFNCYLKDGT